jgi:hypothetical protein
MKNRFVIDFGYRLGLDGIVLPRRVVFRVQSVVHVDGEPMPAPPHAVPVGAYDERLDDELPVIRFDDLEVLD